MADITSSILLGATAIPAPLITPGGGKGHSGVARGANYFFGFLITFAALLLIFVGCGIGTRRRIVGRRNTTFYETVDPWGNIIRVNSGTQHKPAMYEPLILEGGEKWDDMEASPASSGLPLASKFVRKPKEKSNVPDINAPPQLLVPTEPPPVHHLDRTTSHIPFASLFNGSRKRKDPIEKDEEPEYDPPEELQVAVMIAMPSPPLPHPCDERRVNRLPEYQIGVNRAPWNYEEIPL